MSFAPSLFLSNIKAKDGLARTNRFKVILPIPRVIGNLIQTNVLEQLINLPNSLVTDITDLVNRASGENPNNDTSNAAISRYLSLQCDSAELPGKTLQTADVKIYGPTFKLPYQKQFNDTTLSFICTNDFYERKLFEVWLDSIMSPYTNNLRYQNDQETKYTADIRVLQYDDFIKQIYAVNLVNAFPIGVASQPLSWSDDGFHRLSVQFAYSYYVSEYKGEYDLGEAAASYFGAKSTKLFDQFFRF
jgi:hypothetical protein